MEMFHGFFVESLMLIKNLYIYKFKNDWPQTERKKTVLIKWDLYIADVKR